MSRQQLIRMLLRDRAGLIAYTWSIVRDEHVAEDIFQDVAALLVEKSAEITSEEHLKGWVRQSARFLALKHLRSLSRKPTTFDTDLIELLDMAWDHIDPAPAAALTDALRHCITELTPNNRRLIELRYTQGASGVRVAATLGRKVESVYQAMARVHRFLAGCIRQRLSKESGDA